MELNLENLAKYTDDEFEKIEKVIAKEKKRREKAAKIKAKLEKQAKAIGYTLAQRDDSNPSREETEAKEETKSASSSSDSSEWNLGTYTGAKAP